MFSVSITYDNVNVIFLTKPTVPVHSVRPYYFQNYDSITLFHIKVFLYSFVPYKGD